MSDMSYERVCQDVSGKFWTRRDELIKELEELNYEVLGDFGEYIFINDGNGDEWLLYISEAGRTIWVACVKEGN